MPMHPLGTFHASAHLAPRIVLLGAAAFGAVLDRLQLAWRDLEASTWWASNGRDVLLVFSVAVNALGLLGVGFPLPAAVLAAAQLTLAAVAVELLLRRFSRRAHDGVAIAATVLLTLPLALAPQSVFELLETFARAAA